MKESTKIYLALAVILLLTVSCFVYIIYAATPSEPQWITGGTYPGAYTFTIWRDGSNYFAKNRLGYIPFSGSNLSGITQACLDNIEANGGGSLYFEPTGGVYTFSYSMLIPSNTFIDFGGSRLKMGSNFNFASISGSDIMMFSNKGFPYSLVANITIQNALIDGNHDSQMECGGIIAIKRGVKITIRNLRVEHTTYDAHDTIILAVTNASIIENVIGYDCGVTDGAFIGLRGCRNIQIRNCYLENSVADLIAIYKETEHVYGVDRYCWDISIAGCTLVGAGRNAIRVEEGNYDIHIQNNRIYDAGRDPTGSYVLNSDSAGIFLYGANDFTIHDNEIRAIAHNQTHGLYVYGYEDILNRTVISGNILRDNTVSDIYLRNVTQTVISNNYFASLTQGASVTALKVHHNLGYITEIAGQALGNHSAWIAFGVTFPAIPQCILATPANFTQVESMILTIRDRNTTHFQITLYDYGSAYEAQPQYILFQAIYIP